jgi:hypothetical protein
VYVCEGKERDRGTNNKSKATSAPCFSPLSRSTVLYAYGQTATPTSLFFSISISFFFQVFIPVTALLTTLLSPLSDEKKKLQAARTLPSRETGEKE